MSEDLILYTQPSSRGRIARWMLEEVGQPYDVAVLDFATSVKDAEFLAVNPMGKVPALRHGEVVVTETAAICGYLADAFPAAGLAPPLNVRGPYYRWLFFAAGPFEQAVVNKLMNFQLPEGGERAAGYGSLDKVIDVLEQTLSGRDYIVGDHFSAADLYLGSQLLFAIMFKAIDPPSAISAYCERLSARPAYKQAAAIDDALMSAA